MESEKKKPLIIPFTVEMREQLKASAEKADRDETNHVRWIVKQYLEGKFVSDYRNDLAAILGSLKGMGLLKSADETIAAMWKDPSFVFTTFAMFLMDAEKQGNRVSVRYPTTVRVEAHPHEEKEKSKRGAA